MFGEVFADGQFRGAVEETAGDKLRAMLNVGDYMIWDVDGDSFCITLTTTGEMGVFKKKDFESHVAAFFGLNF
jgi:hypothetical protein